MPSTTDQLIALVRELAERHQAFIDVLGPGAGNDRANAFTAQLIREARNTLGVNYAEFRYSEDQSARYDFYIPEERTVIEVAWGLPNPNSEFEKDIFKALIGREHGHEVDRLVLISRPGAVQKCRQPGRQAVIRWVESNHRLEVQVVEVDGQRRMRQRR
ncbi:hypothetical protein [Gemmatimonas sp.]|jgi:hypothetical protein|uniref:hypothetical protein n=1 Tax=Gemmatimonas sp. TaxID=1962908 RepID=UPI00333EDCF4